MSQPLIIKGQPFELLVKQLSDPNNHTLAPYPEDVVSGGVNVVITTQCPGEWRSGSPGRTTYGIETPGSIIYHTN